MSTLEIHEGFWVGVDVAKATFDAGVAPDNATPAAWASLRAGHFEMSAKGVRAFAAWLAPALAKGTCLGVCLESTGCYSQRCAALLAPLGLPAASIVNPALPLAFRKSMGLRDKCDRVDAAVLALYGVVHRPRRNAVPSAAHQKLRALWRLQEDYAKDLRAWSNRLEQEWEKEALGRIKGTVAHLQKQYDAVWTDIEQCVKEHEALRKDFKLMCSIPGIGKKTAVMALAELGDLRTWRREELASYAGLYPKQYASGSSVLRRPTLARGGGYRIRKALFLPACSHARLNTPLAQWRKKLLEKNKAKKSTIAALMRKLLLLMRAVVVSGKDYDPQYAQGKTA